MILPNGLVEVHVLITGSRDWEKRYLIWHYLTEIRIMNGNMTVVHGDCPTGADRMAREWCESMNKWHQGKVVEEERHPARWDLYGKRAGFLRNKFMAELGADICLAFNRNRSLGTSHCVNCAREEGIPVLEFTDA